MFAAILANWFINLTWEIGGWLVGLLAAFPLALTLFVLNAGYRLERAFQQMGWLEDSRVKLRLHLKVLILLAVGAAIWLVLWNYWPASHRVGLLLGAGVMTFLALAKSGINPLTFEQFIETHEDYISQAGWAGMAMDPDRSPQIRAFALHRMEAPAEQSGV